MSTALESSYQAIIVGSGFSGAFFLHAFLKQAPRAVRVLWLERGPSITHHQQAKNPFVLADMGYRDYRRAGSKSWIVGTGVGGGSNLWWGCTPRMLPSDFHPYSERGIAIDWPLSYEDLEPFYCEAEEIMGVSGQEAPHLFPRSRPFPLPPHRMTDPEQLLSKGFPGFWIPQPCARPRLTHRGRPACCASGNCGYCPIDSKFTVLNGFKELFGDARVEFISDATVMAIDHQQAIARGVIFEHKGREFSAKADCVVLAANAIFNPFLLASSSIGGVVLGRFLNEQVSVSATLNLEGIKNFQGSTSITGHGYQFYAADSRDPTPRCLIESWNVPDLRTDKDRWTERLVLKFIFEDIPSRNSYVDGTGRVPTLHYAGPSSFAQSGIDSVRQKIEELAQVLPIERIVSMQVSETEGHVQGTTRMSRSPDDGIVDPRCIHHQVRNLVVLGSSVFPSCPPANPTLTISALALRAGAGIAATL